MRPATLSVIVPTYGRPDYLDSCLDALAAALRPPDEIVVVARTSDAETLALLRSLAPSLSGLRVVEIAEEGHMPPVRAGTRAASGEIVALTDDDARPDEAWSVRLLDWFDQPAVGAVCGRIVNIGMDDLPPARHIGEITWYGQLRGNFYRRPIDPGPRSVQCFPANNVAMRGSLWRSLEFDYALNGGAATDYEVDLSFQIRRRGLRIVYDPDLVVYHYDAPRRISVRRGPGPEALRAYAHNWTYLGLKNFGLLQRPIFLLYWFLIGQRAAWAPGSVLIDLLRGQAPSWSHEILPSFSGRVDGLATYVANRRGRWRAAPVGPGPQGGIAP